MDGILSATTSTSYNSGVVSITEESFDEEFDGDGNREMHLWPSTIHSTILEIQVGEAQVSVVVPSGCGLNNKIGETLQLFLANIFTYKPIDNVVTEFDTIVLDNNELSVTQNNLFFESISNATTDRSDKKSSKFVIQMIGINGQSQHYLIHDSADRFVVEIIRDINKIQQTYPYQTRVIVRLGSDACRICPVKQDCPVYIEA